METIQGTVSRIIYLNEDSGYRVLRIKTVSGSPTIMTGELGPEMIPGTVADFHGDFRSHPKYGSQFRVKSYNIRYNAEQASSIQIFIDAIAPNIGKERSAAIIHHFKDDTIRILDEEPNRLLEVEGIGTISANSLAEAWKKNRDRWNNERQIYSLRSFLYSLGIKERRVKRILSHYGGGLLAEEHIRADPYSLIEVEGFGFTTVDFIGRQLGIPPEDQRRLTAFIKHLIYDVCPSNGHLYFTKPVILEFINKYCSENGTSFLGHFVTETDVDNTLGYLKENVVIDNECIYSPKNFRFERDSASLLGAFVSHPSDLIFLNHQTVEDFIKDYETNNAISFSPEQKQALFFFAEQKVFIITGPPGTGKTTLLKSIVELAIKRQLRLTCMTPTGISAKKLADTIQFDAFTVHRRLGYRGNEWLYNENNQFDTDLVIVDEVSMLDQEVLYRLLSALKLRTHLLFVGDSDQLPSVGAGNVLKEMINCGSIPTVKLERIFRQDEASDIVKAAHKIRKGDSDLSLFKEDPAADITFLRMKEPSQIASFIVSLARKFKNERRLFQIITPRNDGPLGVEPLNKALQEALNPPEMEPLQVTLGTYIIRRGDRVIVRKNDYELEVFNGDIGKVTAICPGRISVLIDDRTIDFQTEGIEEKLRLAYAITTHKSQGLEYPYIILPFINQFGRNMLQRNLLYTAITRARERIIVLGHGSALERAINNGSVSKRFTRLGERISTCIAQRKKESSQPLPGQSVNSLNALNQKEPYLSDVTAGSLDTATISE